MLAGGCTAKSDFGSQIIFFRYVYGDFSDKDPALPGCGVVSEDRPFDFEMPKLRQLVLNYGKIDAVCTPQSRKYGVIPSYVVRP